MANNIALGVAEARPDVYTVTFANTWAASDSVTVKVGADASLTMTTDTATLATIADQFARAFNAVSRDDNLQGSETRNTGGQSIPQLREVEAYYPGSGAVVYLTGPVGTPVELVVTVTTAGSGTATLATVQSATGPEFWDNADNWGTKGVPTNGDDVVIPAGVRMKYGLPNGSLEPDSVWVQGGQLGLPKINRDDPAHPYTEYRDRFAVFDNDNSASSVELKIGTARGDGPALVSVQWDNTTALNLTVFGTGSRGTGDHAVEFRGEPAAMAARIDAGSVAFGKELGHTTDIGQIIAGQGNPAIYVGPSAAIADVTGVVMASGTLTLDACAFSTSGIECNGGTCVLNVDPAAPPSFINSWGDAVVDAYSPSAATIATLRASGEFRFCARWRADCYQHRVDRRRNLPRPEQSGYQH